MGRRSVPRICRILTTTAKVVKAALRMPTGTMKLSSARPALPANKWLPIAVNV